MSEDIGNKDKVVLKKSEDFDIDIFKNVLRFLDDVEDFLSLMLSVRGLYWNILETGTGGENILFRLYDFPRKTKPHVRKLFIYSSRQLNLITLNRNFENLSEILYIPFLDMNSPTNISISCDKDAKSCPHSNVQKIEMISLNDVMISHIPSLRSVILKKPKDMGDEIDEEFSIIQMMGLPQLSHIFIRGNWKFETNTRLEVFRDTLVEIDLDMDQVNDSDKVSFSHYPNLTHLTLSLHNNELERIKSCPKLRFIELIRCGSSSNISLELLPSIHSIILRGDCGQVKFDDTIHKIRRLKILGETDLEYNLDECQNLNDLEYMNLHTVDPSDRLLFEEVGMVLSKLTYLAIHVRHSERNLRVYDLPNLSHLKISSCFTPRLKSLPKLTNLTLIYLPVSTTTPVSFFDGITSTSTSPKNGFGRSVNTSPKRYVPPSPYRLISPSIGTGHSHSSLHSSSLEFRNTGIYDHVERLRTYKENIKLNRLIRSFGDTIEILSVQFSNQSEVLLELGTEMKRLRSIFVGSYSKNFDNYDPGLPYDISRFFHERYKYSPITYNNNRRRNSNSSSVHTKYDLHKYLPSISLSGLPELKTLQVIQRVGCLLLSDLRKLRSLTFDQLFKINIKQVPRLKKLNLVLAKQWMFKMIRTENVKVLSLQLSEITRIDGGNFPNLRHLLLLKYVVVKTISSLPKLRKLDIFQSSFENISRVNISELVIDFSNPNPEPYEIDFASFGRSVRKLVLVDSTGSDLERMNIFYRNLDEESFPNLRKLEIHGMSQQIASCLRDFKKLEVINIIRPCVKMTRIVLENLPEIGMVVVTSRMNQEIEVVVKRCNPKVKIISK